MKLYLISQGHNQGYDTYDSAVVAAESEEDAKLIRPGGGPRSGYDGWCDPEYVECVYLGEAKEGSESGVICASYNAG